MTRPTPCNPTDSSPPGPLSVGSPGDNAGVGFHSLLQDIFLSQGSNPGLPHCRCILYWLNQQGSPGEPLFFKTGVFSMEFSKGIWCGISLCDGPLLLGCNWVCSGILGLNSHSLDGNQKVTTKDSGTQVQCTIQPNPRVSHQPLCMRDVWPSRAHAAAPARERTG